MHKVFTIQTRVHSVVVLYNDIKSFLLTQLQYNIAILAFIIIHNKIDLLTSDNCGM